MALRRLAETFSLSWSQRGSLPTRIPGAQRGTEIVAVSCPVGHGDPQAAGERPQRPWLNKAGMARETLQLPHTASSLIGELRPCLSERSSVDVMDLINVCLLC